MVSLLPRSQTNTLPNKQPLQFPLILRLLHSLQTSRVCNSRYRICLLGQRNLVFVLDNPAFLNSGLEKRKVFLVEREEGDVIGDLVFDRPDRRILPFMGEVGVYIGSSENCVDLVSCEGVFF